MNLYKEKQKNKVIFPFKDPGLPIRRWILSDLIGSDDPTESYTIPGDGIALDSVGRI